jgi:hypothetical protein
MKWLTIALEKNKQATAGLKAKALNGVALVTSYQGNFSYIKTLCKESAQKTNDKHETALALELLGVATAMEGDLNGGILLLRQTRHLAQEQEDKWMQEFHCVDLGYALMRQENYSDAEAIFHERVRVSHEISMKKSTKHIVSPS